MSSAVALCKTGSTDRPPSSPCSTASGRSGIRRLRTLARRLAHKGLEGLKDDRQELSVDRVGDGVGIDQLLQGEAVAECVDEESQALASLGGVSRVPPALRRLGGYLC